MSNHFCNANDRRLDDLTQTGSRSQSEYVLDAKDCLYTLEVYLAQVNCMIWSGLKNKQILEEVKGLVVSRR